MDVLPSLESAESLDRLQAVNYAMRHSGLFALLLQLQRRFNEAYFRNNDAEGARKYIEAYWAETIRPRLENMPRTVKSELPGCEPLIEKGWLKRTITGSGVFRGNLVWDPQKWRDLCKAVTLEELLGASGYAKMWGGIFFTYLRTTFVEMKLGDSLSNDEAEDLVLRTEAFSQRGYGAMFGREVQRIWVPQQALQWATEQLPLVMQDLKDSHRLLAAMLVRIYTGVHETPRTIERYGSWRPETLSRHGLGGRTGRRILEG